MRKQKANNLKTIIASECFHHQMETDVLLIASIQKPVTSGWQP